MAFSGPRGLACTFDVECQFLALGRIIEEVTGRRVECATTTSPGTALERAFQRYGFLSRSIISAALRFDGSSSRDRW